MKLPLVDKIADKIDSNSAVILSRIDEHFKKHRSMTKSKYKMILKEEVFR